MSSKSWLNKKDKMAIAWLYHNTKLSVGKIADIFDVCNDTVNNYKDYFSKLLIEKVERARKESEKTKEAPIVKAEPRIEFKLKEQELIQKIFHDFETLQWYDLSEINIKNLISKRYWSKAYNYNLILNWPPFKGSNKETAINAIIELLFKMHNEKSIEDSNKVSSKISSEDSNKDFSIESDMETESKQVISTEFADGKNISSKDYGLNKIKELLGYDLSMDIIKIMELLRYHAPFYQRNANKRSEPQRIRFIENNMLQDLRSWGFVGKPDVIDDILINMSNEA